MEAHETIVVGENRSRVNMGGRRDGLALCLSGGGYRAMLFHVGALWRLNEAGYLPRLERVSSVSGGSIAAGMLGFAWSQLDFDERGVGQGFLDHFVVPLRALAARTIDLPAVVFGLVGPGTAADFIARTYRRQLFGDATLQDLPDDARGPRFIINATNLQSGVLWRFSRPYARDYRVGEIPSPRISLGMAVAASSAYPPLLSPAILHFDEAAFTPGTGHDLQRPPFTTRVLLTDGGVYDNLGLEPVKRFATVLVSDGGAGFRPAEKVGTDWARQGWRVVTMMDNQVRSLRKRRLVEQYQRLRGGSGQPGAYWGIETDIADYALPDALPCPVAQTRQLARIGTRLGKLSARTQERLINWGFAACDAALRRYVDPDLAGPGAFPYPASGVGESTSELRVPSQPTR